MSGLKTLLEPSSAWLSHIKVRPPEMVLLPRAVAKLSGADTATDGEPTEALQWRVLTVLKEKGAKALPGRDLKNICRVFLHPPHAPGRDTDMARLLVEAVKTQERRSALFGLIDSYLDRFQADDPDIKTLGRHLETLSQGWPWRPEDAWPRLQDEVELFDSERSPIRIAERVMQDDKPVLRLLEGVNLGGELRRQGGLCEAAFRQACRTVSEKTGLPAIPVQQRLIEWANVGSQSFVYTGAWWNYAEALFKPWQTLSPPEAHQNRLMDIAIKYAGDPRTGGGSKWKRVEQYAPAAYGVIMRWLTKASFEQFFAIVDQMTDRPDMWRQRKAFWSQYLNASPSLISDAWVVFGKDGALRAEKLARQNQNEALRKFGRLGSGKTPQHTALIMKIGDLTVVEWSHNGKWNIWRKGDARTPPFHKFNSRNLPDYEAYELMYGPLNGAHHSGWESTVRYTIQQETGLRP